MSDGNTLRERALRYHSKPTPGKIALSLTTATENADDLALAYSPGVGEPVKEKIIEIKMKTIIDIIHNIK